MPSSGSYTATYGGHPFTLQLNWSVASQNIALNQSTINWSLYTIKTTANTPFRSDGAATFAFNYYGSGNWGPYNFNGAVGQSVLMASGSFTVTHASDGTYTLSTSFSANALSTITTASGSGSDTLPTIPRATQPTVSPVSGNTGSTYAISVSTVASSAFYHDFYYSLDGGSTYTSIFTNIPATTTSENWTPASSLLPNASSVTAIIRVDTRASSGGTILGTKTVNLPLTVPSSVVPTISAVSFVDSQTSSPDIPTMMGGSGRFVQGWSKLNPTVTSSGASGSTVTSSTVTMNGKTTPSGTAFTSAVGLSGAVPYSAITTDSRSRNSVAFTGTCTVKAYSFPNLPTPVIQRTSDAAGLIPDPAGTYLAITPAASVSDLTFSGSQKNNLDYQIRTQPDTGGSWTTVTAWTSAAGITWTTKRILTGYSATTGWNVEISIRDVFGHNGFNTANTVQILTVHVPTETIFMDMDQGKGLGLGKYRDQTTGLMLDVQGDTHVSGDVAATTMHQGGHAVVDTTLVATTSVTGLTTLATDAQAIAGTDTAHAVTPHADAAATAAALVSPLARLTALELRPQGKVPSSVTVGSGSASIAADGTVTFTGCSSVALNGVFDGVGADEYMILVALTTSGAATVSSRLRSAGTNVTTGYNYAGSNTQLSAGPTRYSGTAQATFGWLAIAAGTGANTAVGTMIIHRPALAVIKFLTATAYAAIAGDRYSTVEGGDAGATASVCDGWALIPSAGTITGTIKVVKLA